MKRLPVVLALLLAACGGGDAVRPSPSPPAPPPRALPPPSPPDPLGPRPAVAEQPAFTPPAPITYERAGGTKVWLLERHNLPMVSVQVVVSAGSAQDPEGKEGLAHITGSMLDEGAGKRGALDFAREVDRLGATISTGAGVEYGYARLTVLKKNFGAAAALLGDAVVRPQLSAVEWKRVHDLWQNGLQARQSEPESVASIVVAAKVFPPGDAYGHPSDGTIASAKKVSLADVKKFYGDSWRSDRAAIVVVGDVTRTELDAELDKAFAGWKPAAAGRVATATVGPVIGAPSRGRRVYVVDRPDAPQSVIAVARLGVKATDPDSAVLSRVNAALGGSFTSRLNQDLREEHGWTYGARSRFGFTRGRGSFVAQAAVQTEHTGDALQAMIADIEKMQREGLTAEEITKTKSLVRAELVEAYETVEAAVSRLGRNAALDLGADYDAKMSKIAADADKAALEKAATRYLDIREAVVVIVGPRAKLEPQLAAIGITSFEVTGPEGQPVTKTGSQ